MLENGFPGKFFGLLAISYWLLATTGCSPRIKVAFWAKKHQNAALALGVWTANNSAEATELLELDCKDHNQFKQKITFALNNIGVENSARQGYDFPQQNYQYGRNTTNHSRDGFGDWCRKYPKAAKKLRSRAKALCKTGLGILNGSIKIN